MWALCSEIVATAARNRHLLLSIGLKGIFYNAQLIFLHTGLNLMAISAGRRVCERLYLKTKKRLFLPEFACRFIWKYKVTLYKPPSRWSDSEVDGYQINGFKRNYCSFVFTHRQRPPYLIGANAKKRPRRLAVIKSKHGSVNWGKSPQDSPIMPFMKKKLPFCTQEKKGWKEN